MTTIREQLEESQKVLSAYPYETLVTDTIPETGEWGVLAYEADEEDDESLVFSHVVVDSLRGPSAERLAHSWNELPKRNAQLAAVLEACEAFMTVAEATGSHPMAKAAHRRCAEDIRRAVEDAAP